MQLSNRAQGLNLAGIVKALFTLTVFTSLVSASVRGAQLLRALAC